MSTTRAVELAESRQTKFAYSLYAGRSRAIIERSYMAFKSSTWVVILTGFMEPVFYLLSFGYGVGKLIGDIEVTPGHRISYAAFLAPALLATSAMNGAIYDSTWNVFFKLRFDRVYQGMLATSLGALDVALGEILWALIRGLLYATAFMSILASLGLVTSWWGLISIPVAILIAFAFASCGMAITTYLKSFEQMNLVNVFILPMFLFSGSFYPLTVFPGWLQGLIKALPLWHGITLMRDASLGLVHIGLLWHVLYFFVMIVVGVTITTRRLNILFLR